MARRWRSRRKLGRRRKLPWIPPRERLPPANLFRRIPELGRLQRFRLFRQSRLLKLRLDPLRLAQSRLAQLRLTQPLRERMRWWRLRQFDLRLQPRLWRPRRAQRRGAPLMAYPRSTPARNRVTQARRMHIRARGLSATLR